jgi:hypothetical protein
MKTNENIPTIMPITVTGHRMELFILNDVHHNNELLFELAN